MATASEASDYGSILHWEGSILHWEADQLFLGIERRLCNPRVDQQEFFDDVERLAEVRRQLAPLRPQLEDKDHDDRSCGYSDEQPHSAAPAAASRQGVGKGHGVGEGGLEPPRVLPHRILNPARLPIPPLSHTTR